MSLTLGAAPPAGSEAGSDRAGLGPACAALLRAGLPCVAAAALWLLCHPYFGVVADATIYLGRALADLDPAGIGRDIAFVYDGQSRFSLFPRLVRPLVASLGPERASIALAAAAACCTFAAMAALARALAGTLPPRSCASPQARADRAWLIVAALAVLPTTYGQLDVFRFGETAALPRPFAEAAVVGAIAALLTRRRLLAAALLFAATVIHPIMAAVGVGAALVAPLIAALSAMPAPKRTALLAAALPPALIAIAAALVLERRDVEPFARLLRPIDEIWLAAIVGRSPHLFPTLWHPEAYGPILAQLAAILIAARRVPPLARAVLLAVAAAALAELGAAALFGDTLHILLVLQMQLWRGTWLLAVAGGAALALTAPELWRESPRGRLVLLLLLLGWFVQPDLATVAVLVALALALRFAPAGVVVADRHVRLAALAAATLTVLWYATLGRSYLAFLGSLPAGMPWEYGTVLGHGLHMVPVALALALLALLPAGMRRGLPLLGGATALLVVLAALALDQRPAYRVAFEEGPVPPAFAALVDRPSAREAAARGPGEVLWLDGGAEPWFLLRRPQWMSPQQAVGIVFSRELAMEWRRRAGALVAAGLVRRAVFTPWEFTDPDDRPRPTAAALAAFCRRPDAPEAVVIPIRDDRPALDLPGSVRWAVPPVFVADTYAVTEWHRVGGVEAMRCAAAPSRAAGKLARVR